MHTRTWAAQNLAARLLAQPWTLPSIAEGIGFVLGPLHPRTRAALTVRVFALGEDSYPPSQQSLKNHLLRSPFFRPKPERPVPAVLEAPRFAPSRPFRDLPVPALATRRDLAEWLGMTVEELDWLADERRCHARAATTPLQHYRYALVAKGCGKVRLLEVPKTRLKAIQRRIMREILDSVPVHAHAHGFVAGRSCLTGAQIHASESMVVTFDLKQFFPSIGLPRVHGLFRSLGYPWEVARSLAGLCTTITPASVLGRFLASQSPGNDVGVPYAVPHLPQGAPPSPALANVLAFALDRRLYGLARAANAHYTRYADDLAFSGDSDFANSIQHFSNSVGKIVSEEGFMLNAAKTRVMPRSTRQRVTGIVVNTHCNTGRKEFDTLKAILHNCVRYGPGAQNHAGVADFRRHLDGRVTWVEQVNFGRGSRLRGIFNKIRWEEGCVLF